MFLFGFIFALLISTNESKTSIDLTESELEGYFRERTISGNRAAAIKINFTVPQPGTAYLGTIHGYPDNLQVCEELIAPYNQDESLTVIPGATYFCQILR